MKARLFEYDWLKKGDADEICFPGTFKSMKWAGFMLCVVSTLMYLFAWTDRFGKRQWRRFGLQCLAVLAGAFLLALCLALLAKSSSLIDRQTARALTLLVPASLMALLMAKLFVVALRVVFDAIMNFHERHNTPENAARLRGLGVRYGAGLWVFVRCLAALGSVVMLYGIWFGTSA